MIWGINRMLAAREDCQWLAESLVDTVVRYEGDGWVTPVETPDQIRERIHRCENPYFDFLAKAEGRVIRFVVVTEGRHAGAWLEDRIKDAERAGMFVLVFVPSHWHDAAWIRLSGLRTPPVVLPVFLRMQRGRVPGLLRYDIYFRSNWDSPEVHLIGARDLLRTPHDGDRVLAFLPGTPQHNGAVVLRSVGGRPVLTRLVTWRPREGEIRFTRDLWRKWEGPYPSFYRGDSSPRRHFSQSARYFLANEGGSGRIAKEDLPRLTAEAMREEKNADRIVVGFEDDEFLYEMQNNPAKDRTLVREMQRDGAGFITHKSVQSWKGPPA